MNIEQILKLVDAGYTKTDIEAFTAGQPAAPAAPAEPAAEPAPAPAEPVKADPVPAQDNSEVLQAIAELTKSIKAYNIVNGAVKEPGKDEALTNALSKLIGG